MSKKKWQYRTEPEDVFEIADAVFGARRWCVTDELPDLDLPEPYPVPSLKHKERPTNFGGWKKRRTRPLYAHDGYL